LTTGAVSLLESSSLSPSQLVDKPSFSRFS
jgi:hypothetical protein